MPDPLIIMFPVKLWEIYGICRTGKASWGTQMMGFAEMLLGKICTTLRSEVSGPQIWIYLWVAAIQSQRWNQDRLIGGITILGHISSVCWSFPHSLVGCTLIFVGCCI